MVEFLRYDGENLAGSVCPSRSEVIRAATGDARASQCYLARLVPARSLHAATRRQACDARRLLPGR